MSRDGTRRLPATKAYEECIRDAFAVFDSDGSGALSAEELRAVLTRPGTGLQLSEADAAEILADFDTNGDGELQIDEFRPLWETFFGGGASTEKAAAQPSRKEKRIRAAFALFDTDGSGALSVDELRAVLTRPGSGLVELSEADVHELIAEFDVNGDGELQRACCSAAALCLFHAHPPHHTLHAWTPECRHMPGCDTSSSH